jgi:ribose 5-phosphate isomerase
MFILYIEHPVPSYDGWKKAFESDPLKRKESGVKSYRIMKPLDKNDNVIIELEFDNIADAENMLEKLKGLWNQVEGKIMSNPVSRILQVKDEHKY